MESLASHLVWLRPALLGRAQRMVGGRFYGAGAPQAEDLVQIALLKLAEPETLARLGEAPDATTLRKYAFRMLHNAFIDRCTRKHTEDVADGDAPEVADSTSSPESNLATGEAFALRREQLTRALATLDAKEREFLKECVELGSAPAAQKKLGFPDGDATNACKRRNSLIERIQRVVANADVGRPTSSAKGSAR